MCGIFLIKSKNLNKKIINNIFKMSESRGKDSSGISMITNKSSNTIKINKRAKELINHHKYKQLLKKIDKNSIVMGHTRMQTHGTKKKSENNQPIVKDNSFVLHNGIITNYKAIADLYEIPYNGKSDTVIFTEVLVKIINSSINIDEKITKLFSKIKGNNSIIFFHKKLNKFFIFSKNGSMYYVSTNETFFFASEKNIIQKFAKKIFPKNEHIKINQLKNDYITFKYQLLIIDEKESDNLITLDLNENKSAFINSKIIIEKKFLNTEKFNDIDRCAKCILPISFPGITFDSNKVCNFCNNYTPILKYDYKKFINQLGKKILFPLSGGRDSAFALYHLSNNYDGEIITYTYDWGMISNKARVNISNICGHLKLENILVSADIDFKRSNVRKNLIAWLKKPSISIIPLLMAGDKSFFYYAKKISKEYFIDNTIFSMSPFEETNFKSLFAGTVTENHNYEKPYHRLNALNQLRIIKTYLSDFIRNPDLINYSLFDTAISFIHYYILKTNYLEFYKFYEWDEQQIEFTIKNNLDFEVYDKNIESSWRIGDLLSPLYNYIYFNYFGFTENDTLRSNQIRAQKISRKDALKLVKIENQPRIEPFIEFLDYLSLDGAEVIEKINMNNPYK